MIKLLQAEYYFGEDTPLICDENGNYTKPSNFRKRFDKLKLAEGLDYALLRCPKLVSAWSADKF